MTNQECIAILLSMEWRFRDDLESGIAQLRYDDKNHDYAISWMEGRVREAQAIRFAAESLGSGELPGWFRDCDLEELAELRAKYPKAD